MKKRLIINAVNVHQGGGKSLLLGLLNVVPDEINVTLLVDKRITFDKDISKDFTIHYVNPSVISRIASELWLSKNVKPDDIVLCFGNLPPLFKVQGKVFLFIQNLYMGKGVKLNNFSFYVKLRILIERLWLYSRIKNVHEIIVQTATMKKVLALHCVNKEPKIVPFMVSAESLAHERQDHAEVVNSDTDNFLYIASGEPHKNHQILVDAWCLLASEGIYPQLTLTVDSTKFSELCDRIQQKKHHYNLKLNNIGLVAKDQVSILYKKADALIYPSEIESFGLPLYEAQQADLPILAAELDYVRDALDPEETFDPRSAISIARAVKRFLHIKEKRPSLYSAEEFLHYLVNYRFK